MSSLPKSILALTLCALLLGASTMAFATPEYLTNTYIAEVQAKAEAQAERDTSRAVWLTIGCLFPVWGNLKAHSTEPLVPIAQLMGKDGKYIDIYSHAYQKHVRRIRVRSAIEGTVSGCLVLGFVLYHAF